RPPRKLRSKPQIPARRSACAACGGDRRWYRHRATWLVSRDESGATVPPSATTVNGAHDSRRNCNKSMEAAGSARESAGQSARSPEAPSLVLLLGRLFRGTLERGAENVAERRARIGGAVLRDGFLLLRHLQRLDRDLHLVGAAIELDHAGIDLLAG